MGKNILIIGASGDIGIAIAEQLAKNQYNLLLHYNNHYEPIQQFKQRIDCECILSEIQADLSTEIGIHDLIKQLVFQVDGVVFAGGTAHFGLFQDLTEMTIDHLIALHIKGPLLITKELLPEMIRRRSGKIVFISSLWGHVGSSHEVMYSTVKGAQNSFVKSLSKEVAPCGVSVNGVSPGFIETKMNQHISGEEKESIVSSIPMNRPGTAEEVAHTVHFLLDEKSSYITGEMIQVTGGW